MFWSMRIGYARVSEDEQNLALQMDALRGANCDLIFTDDGVSGITVIRPALDKALTRLSPGDVFVIWKLDRLGRSLAHLIAVEASLKAGGIGFYSVTEAIDTTTAVGMLLFHILGAVAQFERTLIVERTCAGMAAARTRGAEIGRPKKLPEDLISEAGALVAAGAASIQELAGEYGVAPITLARALRRRAQAAF